MSVMMITLSGCQTSAKTGGFISYDEHYQKNETALKEDALSDRWESRGSKVAVVSKEKADNNDYPEAKEVLLVNNTKNKVIVSQKVFDQAYPASTTKIMTALLTLENLNLSQVVTIKHDITFPDGAAVAIHLKKGDKITVEALLNALIIMSANDAAVALGEAVAGSEANFVKMMNKRAKELGATNTHFANSSGLPDDNHYSSARDMALIMREGLKNDDFRTVIGTADYTIQPTNMNAQQRVLHTHHPMFAPESGFYYQGCIGGKTGTTVAAGHTLVTAATRDNTTYIAVTMRAADLANSCMDSTAMFNYGFDNFTKTEVDGGSVLLPKGTDLNSLTKKSEDVNGKTETSYYFGEYLVGSGSVAQATATPTPEPTAASDQENTEGSETETAADQTAAKTEKSTASKESSETEGMPVLRKILLGIMAVMILILIALLVALRIKEKKHANKYR